MVTNWVDRHSSISRPAAGRQQRGPNGISLSAEPTSAFVCPRRAPRALEKLAASDGERSERGESLWPSRRFATGYEQPATTRNSDGGDTFGRRSRFAERAINPAGRRRAAAARVSA